MSPQIRTAVVAAYGLMCLIWGTTWLAIKIGLQGMGPLSGVGIRFVLAGALLYIIAAARREICPIKQWPWKLIVTLAFFTFMLDYCAVYIGETRIQSGLAAVLFGTFPFFTFAFSRFMLRERTPPPVLFGACVAFAGVAIISVAQGVHGSFPYAVGVVGGAAAAAYANVYIKGYGAVPPLVSLPPAMVLAGVLVAAIGLIVEPFNWHHALAAPSIAALLYLVLAGTCLTFFLLLWLLARLSAGVVGMATLIFPVVALVTGALFGAERLSSRDIFGCALVLGGVALAFMPQYKQQGKRAPWHASIGPPK